jgi:lipoprotein signal peptidase
MSQYDYGSVEYGVLNDKWWDLRLNITALIFAGSFICMRIGSEGFYRMILSIGVGLSVSNVIDRIFFDVQIYTFADIFMVIGTLTFSIYDYVKGGRKISK